MSTIAREHAHMSMTSAMANGSVEGGTLKRLKAEKKDGRLRYSICDNLTRERVSKKVTL